jgi:hypothetical protein
MVNKGKTFIRLQTAAAVWLLQCYVALHSNVVSGGSEMANCHIDIYQWEEVENLCGQYILLHVNV